MVFSAHHVAEIDFPDAAGEGGGAFERGCWICRVGRVGEVDWRHGDDVTPVHV